MSVYLFNAVIYYIDLRPDNLIVNCLLLKLYRKPRKMVEASHRKSEGCGFDFGLGLGNIFLSLR